MARAAAPPRAGLTALLAAKEMVLVCGSGGVGKTTAAAAMGVQAASEIGGRVLVLTVDPARRLADALGVGALGNNAIRVPEAAFAAAGVAPRGELWAAMLDTKAGWDELIRRHAPDVGVRGKQYASGRHLHDRGGMRGKIGYEMQPGAVFEQPFNGERAIVLELRAAARADFANARHDVSVTDGQQATVMIQPACMPGLRELRPVELR